MNTGRIIGGLSGLYMEADDSCNVEDVILRPGNYYLPSGSTARTRTITNRYICRRRDIADVQAILAVTPANLTSRAGKLRGGIPIDLSWGADYVFGGIAIQPLSTTFARLDAKYSKTFTDPETVPEPGTDPVDIIGGFHENGQLYLETETAQQGGARNRAWAPYDMLGAYFGDEVKAAYLCCKRDLRKVLSQLMTGGTLYTGGGRTPAGEVETPCGWTEARLELATVTSISPSMCKITCKYYNYTHLVVAEPPAGLEIRYVGGTVEIWWLGSHMETMDSGLPGKTTGLTFAKVPVSNLTFLHENPGYYPTYGYDHGMQILVNGIVFEEFGFHTESVNKLDSGNLLMNGGLAYGVLRWQVISTTKIRLLFQDNVIREYVSS